MKKYLATWLLSCWCISAFAQPPSIRPFTSDGCSAFPDGTIERESLWLNCCIEHDLAYWQGGSYVQRQQADAQLKTCVAKLGQPEIAEIMLTGVRIGGTPYVRTPFRWAYGWDDQRGYRALTQKEKNLVKQQLNAKMLMLNNAIKLLDKRPKSK